MKGFAKWNRHVNGHPGCTHLRTPHSRRVGTSRVSRRKSCRPSLEALEPRLLLDGTVTLIRTFDTWPAGIIKSTDPSGITYHAPSGHLIIADSEIDEIPAIFTGSNLFEVSLKGDQVFREVTS